MRMKIWLLGFLVIALLIPVSGQDAKADVETAPSKRTCTYKDAEHDSLRIVEVNRRTDKGVEMARRSVSGSIENTIPILGVKDLEASIKFYTETLGFKLDWRANLVCSISRDGCAIMLSQTDQRNRNSWVWIGLRDDSLFEIYRSRNVTVYKGPMNHPWAYEMKFEDIDGNKVIASSLKYALHFLRGP